MYIGISLFFVICILFYFIHFFRRKWIIRKVRCMDFCKKLCLLNDLVKPFGFSYVPEEDIMTSTMDAWQKDFGYCSLYDKSASKFNMVLDCEPIYFDYNNQTWMIEFWKGQYGISLGGEIGIYKADTLVPPEQYDRTLFHGVSGCELLPMSMEMNFKGQSMFYIHREHWWLTGFRIGSFCEPEDLVMDISITFPNEAMLQVFVESLGRTGYSNCEFCICKLTVSLSFSLPHTWQPRLVPCWFTRLAQWHNRIFCKLFQWITRPFTCTLDRILYLYFFLPVLFRRMLCLKKNRRQHFHKRKRKCK